MVEECVDEIVYNVTGFYPRALDVTGGSFAADGSRFVTVLGTGFRDSHNITALWRFADATGGQSADQTTACVFTTQSAVVCDSPKAAPVAHLGQVPGRLHSVVVSISLWSGYSDTFTPASSAALGLFACDGGCQGAHASCGVDGTCECDPGWGGLHCDTQCPVGSPVSSASDGTSATGAWPCSGPAQGLCDAATGRCKCAAGFAGDDCATPQTAACAYGYYGPLCAEVCPGSFVAGSTSSSAVQSVCNQHGQCSATGECLCDPNAGFFGPACSQQCPAQAPASGNDDQPWWADDTSFGSSGWPEDIAPESSPSPEGSFDSASSPRWSDLWFPDRALEQGTGEQGCSGHGVCLSSGSCHCDSGWTGESCSTRCGLGRNDDGALQLCSGHGRCSGNLKGCLCEPGFYGIACEKSCGVDEQGQSCSGHGFCNPVVGGCACSLGYWGDQCANNCPGLVLSGGSETPCSGHGVCSPGSGVCTCLAGWGGLDCGQACPVAPSTGLPCGGSANGVCDAASGTCHCNPTYSGPSCTDRSCLFDCYGHGDCQVGVCKCNSGWDGDYCSRPSAGAGTVLAWDAPLGYLETDEGAGVLLVNLTRSGDLSAVASVMLTCEGFSAVAGEDFECSTYALRWEAGEGGGKSFLVDILVDNKPEGVEAFGIAMSNVRPTDATLVNGGNLTVIIVANDEDLVMEDSVSVRVTMMMSPDQIAVGSPGFPVFEAGFIDELADRQILNTDRDRIAIDFTSPTLGRTETIVGFTLLPPRSGQWRQLAGGGAEEEARFLDGDDVPDYPDQPNRQFVSAAELAGVFREMVAEPRSALYSVANRFTRHVDGRFEPTIVVHGDASPADPPRGWSTGGILAAILVPLALLGLCAFLIYRNRRSLSEWILWKAGQMRFSSLAENEHRTALERELDELESPGAHSFSINVPSGGDAGDDAGVTAGVLSSGGVDKATGVVLAGGGEGVGHGPNTASAETSVLVAAEPDEDAYEDD